MRHFLLLVTLAVAAVGCSSVHQQHMLSPTITTQKSHLRVVSTESERTPVAIDIALRDGVIRASLYESAPLIRLDLLFMNDGLQTLQMPPSFFSLVDAGGAPLRPLAPGEAAELVMASNPERAAEAGEIFESGLTAETRIAPRSKQRASVYWVAPETMTYPLHLRAPKLATDLTYTPDVAEPSTPMMSDSSIISNMAYPDDTAPMSAFDHASHGRTSLFLYGGYNTYAMSDLNDKIDQTNELLSSDFDHLDAEFAFGIDLLRTTSPKLGVGLGVERILGKTSASDDNNELTYSADGWAVRGFSQYSMFESKVVRASIEGGLGMMIATGQREEEAAGLDPQRTGISGYGFLGQVGIPVEFAVHPRVAMTTRFGYRYAPISQVKVEDEDAIGLDGDPLEFDYSGMTVQAGITVR